MGNFPLLLLLHCNPKTPQPPWRFILTPEQSASPVADGVVIPSILHIISLEMGQSMSCGTRPEHGIFASVQCGDIVTVRRVMTSDPSLLHQTTPYDRHSVLHVAAASGQIEVSFLRDLAGISPESRISDVFCYCRFWPCFWNDLRIQMCWIVTSRFEITSSDSHLISLKTFDSCRLR